MKRSRSPKLISRACLFAAAALLSVGAPPSARAANIFFDQNGATAGTGATGAASFNGAFWVNAGAGTTIPGTAAAAAYTFTNADVAYFIGGTVQTITLASATTLNGINDQTGMTFAAQTFTLAGTTPTINVLTAKTTTISSVLAGTAGLTKAGAGTLVLSGTNTYTGGTFMTAGKLSVGADANLGATAGGLTFNGGTLLSSGTFSSARGVTMTGAGTIEVASAQTLTMTGAFSGAGALTKTGAGTLLFNTTGKAYTGNTTVSAGALTLGVGGSTGAIRGTVTVASGAQLLSTAVDASGYGSGAKLNVINLTGNGSLAALSHTGAGNFGWGVTYNLTGAIMQSNGGTNNATTTQAFSFGGISTTDVNKVVTLASANESKILGRVILRENNLNNRAIFDVADGTAAVDLRVGAFITQSAAGFGIEKTGAGLMLLEQDNSFTGQTHILGGRLQIASDAKLGTAPTAATAGQITFNNGGLLNTTADMTLNANRGVALTGSGGFGVTSGTLTYGGIIAGAGVLQKGGAGALVLTGTNTFTGGVNLFEGSITIGAANRFGTNGAMNFNNNGKLITTANLTLAGANTLAGNGQLAPDAGTTLIISGAYSGVGSLTMSGAGLVVLNGTSSYTGGTNFTAGAVQVAADANLGAAAGALTFNNDGRLRSTGSFTAARAVTMTGAGTFNIDGDQTVTVSGVVSGAGLITKMGLGELQLTGTNTFTSKLNITGGTLSANASAALGAAPATLTADWATLAGTSTYLRATGSLALGGNRGITLNNGGGLSADAGFTLTADTTFTATGTGASVLRLGNLGTTGGLVYLPPTAVLPAATTIDIVQSGALAATGLYSDANAWLASGKIAPTSTGTLALTSADAAANIDLSTTYKTLGLGASAAVTYTGTITPGTDGYVLGGGTGTLTVSTVLSGANELVLNNFNSGSVILTQANTYTGPTDLTTGSLSINNAAAIGSGFFTVRTATTIDNGSGAALALSANPNGSFGVGAIAGGTITFTNTNSLDLGSGMFAIAGSSTQTFNVVANTLRIGALTGTTQLRKQGVGTLSLAGTGLYTGEIVLDGGNANFESHQALSIWGKTAFSTFSSGMVLDLGGDIQSQRRIGAILEGYASPIIVTNGSIGLIGDASAGVSYTARGTVNSTLDMSGVSVLSYKSSLLGRPSFNANGASFDASATTTNVGLTLNFAGINAITAGRLTFGAASTDVLGQSNTINFGTVNLLNTDRLQFGQYTAGATAAIRSGVVNPVFVLRAQDGGDQRAATLFVNYMQSGGKSSASTVNLTGAQLDVRASMVQIGGDFTGGTTNTTSTGAFIFNRGLFDASVVRLATSESTGTLTTTSNIATFTQDGGTARIGSLVLGRTFSAGLGSNRSATYTLNNGTLFVGGVTGTPGLTNANSVRNFNLAGGILRNFDAATDLTLTSVDATATGRLNINLTNAPTIQVDAGRTITVEASARLQGLGSLTKAGEGSLVLRGYQSHLGGTVLNEGTLLLDFRSSTNASNILAGTTSSVVAAGGSVGGSAIAVASTAGLATGQIVGGTGVVPGSIITGITSTVPTFVPTADQVGVGTFLAYTGSTAEFFVGMPVSGTGITAGSVIAAITPGVGITLNKETTSSVLTTATVTGSASVLVSKALVGVPAGNLTTFGVPVATAAAGSVIGETRVAVESFGTLAIGQYVSGTGIPNGATVTALTSVAPTFSPSVDQTAVGTTLDYTGSSAAFFVGMPITGTGIDVGTVITAITDGVSITLSKPTLTPVLAATTLTGARSVTLSSALTAVPTALTTYRMGTLTLGGGTLAMNARDGIAQDQSFASTTFTPGASTVRADVGGVVNFVESTALLSLGALSRQAGGTVDFILPAGTVSADNGITTTSANNAAGIIGAWATVGGSSFASVNAGGQIVGLANAAYNTNTWATNKAVDVTTSGTIADASVAHALRFAAAGATTLTLGGTATLEGAGILVTTGVGANDTTITGGTLAANGEIVVQQFNGAGKLILASILADGTAPLVLTKTGSGELVLSGVNTFTGATNLNAGTLTLGASGVLADAAALAINGGTLNVANNETVGAVTMRAGTISGAATLSATSFALQSGTVSAILGGAGDLTKLGNGTLTLSAANTFTGRAILNQGRVNITAANNLGDVSAAFVADALTLGGATLATSGSLDLGVNRGVTLAGDSSLDVESGNLTISGILAGAANLEKVGAGALTLSGANTFTGVLTQRAGQLNLASAGALGAGSFFFAGSALDNTSGASLATTGGDFYALGNLNFVGTNDLSLGGRFFLPNDVTITIGSGDTLTLAGQVLGGGILAKQGAGTLVISGQNGATGGTNVEAGTLRTGAANALSDFSLSVSAGATVELGGNENVGLLFGSGSIVLGANALTIGSDLAFGTNAFTGTISGAGSLVKFGTGTQSLLTANTYTGGTVVRGGTLVVANSSALGTGAIRIESDNSTGFTRLLLRDGINLANNLSIAGGTSGVGNGAIMVQGRNSVATLSGTISVGPNQPSGNIGGGVFIGPVGGIGYLNITGALNVDETGFLARGSNSGLSFRNGNIRVSGGGSYTKLTLNQGRLIVGATDGLVTAATVTMAGAGDGWLDLNGFNQTLANIVRPANTAFVLNDAQGTTSTLTLNPTADTTIDARLTAGLGTLAFTKAGSANLTLSNGSNTFYGQTRITGGKLILDNALALQNSNVVVGNGDTGLLSFGTLTAVTLGGLVGDRSFALTNGATVPAVLNSLTLGNSLQNATYSGVLSRPTRVTGNGTLATTTTVTMTDVTGIVAGMTVYGAGVNNGTTVTAIDEIAKTVTLSAAATKSGETELVFEPTRFTLTKQGTGNQTLSGVSTFAGTTVANQNWIFINGGALTLGAGSLSANNKLILQGGGALTIAGDHTTATGWLNSGRIARNATGALALTADSAEAISFANFPYLALGANGNVTYTGALTPGRLGYRLGGGTGTLTLSADAFTSTKPLTIAGSVAAGGTSGKVVLTGTTPAYTGRIDVRGGGLQLSALGGIDWSSAGQTLNLSSVAGSFGTTLTLAGDLTIGRATSFVRGATLIDTGADDLTFTANLRGTGEASQVVKLGTGSIVVNGTGSNNLGAGAVVSNPNLTGNLVWGGATIQEGSLILDGGNAASYNVGRAGEFIIGNSYSRPSGVEVESAVVSQRSGILNIGSWLTVGRGSYSTATTNSLLLSGNAVTHALNFSTGFNAGQGLTASRSVVEVSNNASFLVVGTNNPGQFNLSESPGSFTALTLRDNAVIQYFGGAVNAGQHRMRVGIGGTAVINVASSTAALRGNAMTFGENDDSAGALYLKGSLQLVGPGDVSAFAIGKSTGGYGYVLVDNAAATLNTVFLSEVGVGGDAGGDGVLEVRSGNVNISAYLTPNRGNVAEQQSLVNVTGGTLTIANLDQNFVNYQAGITNGQAQINVTGAGQLLGGAAAKLNLMYAAADGSRTLGVLNVTNGGLAQLNQIYANSANGLSLVNVDGGTLRATAAQDNFIDSRIRATTIYDGGLTVDTNGFAVGIKSILAGSTGMGVGAVALSATGTGYLGAPLVRLVGGGGTGATAVAPVPPPPTRRTSGAPR